MGRIRFGENNRVELVLPKLEVPISDILIPNESLEVVQDSSTVLSVDDNSQVITKSDIEILHKYLSSVDSSLLKLEEISRDVSVAHEKIDGIAEEFIMLTKDVSLLEEKISLQKEVSPIIVPEVKEVIVTKVDRSLVEDLDISIDELTIEQVEMSNRIKQLESANKKLLYKVNKQNLLMQVLVFGAILLTIILSIH